MKKLLFVFELHGSTEVVEFFRRTIPLMHEKGYRNIGYELNQNEAERVIHSQQLIGSNGRPSPRQAINDLFMTNNARCKITGLDVPELNDLNRFILNLFLPHLFEQMHFAREHHIFNQARKSSEQSGIGSVNLLGCNHVGIMHQLITYALRENQLDLLKQCKFVFLVETGYPKPNHLFGTELPAYPLDALFINTDEGLGGIEKKLREYLERPVTIPDVTLLSQIQQKVVDLTQQQTRFYDSYCKQLFRVFNNSGRLGIQLPTIIHVQEAFRPTILELAKLTLEAVNNNGKITTLTAKISKEAISVLQEVGFQFISRKQQAMDAYRSNNQFERAEELFEQCLNESTDRLESITLKYNLASACRETKKIEKSLKLFYQVTVEYYQIHQKDLSKNANTLCKYLARYFDLLNLHSSYKNEFESQSAELFEMYQSAKLEDEALLTTMQTVISLSQLPTL